jgi:pyruvate dehydrogenase E2 component (dihydrolipoamide acetyltransferase)
MIEIRMPKMGDGMEEGTILRWIKHEGDEIAEIETDKANVPIPAEDAGILAQVVVEEGKTVPVGAIIAYINPPGTVPPDNGMPDRVATGEAGSTTPDAYDVIPDVDIHPPVVVHEHVKVSPIARRMAEEMGLDLSQIAGTGGGVGRITKRDVMTYLAGKRESGTPAAVKTPLPTAATPAPTVAETPRKPVPVPAASPTTTTLAAPAAPTQEGQDTEISRMRRTIARRTVQSKQTIPHFYLVMPVDMDRAMKLLSDLNADTPDQKITVNDLIVKACAVALTKYPDVNVSYTPDEKIRRYSAINIGIAVGTDDGLTVPVISDCGSRSLRQISAEAKALIGKARGGTLTPQEMSGGTFSVSNLGMFGVEEFAAIINPPESAILAVGAVAPEVTVREDGGYETRQRMRITLSCDHRTVDGLLGAKFLQEIRRLLENPFSLLA